MSPVFCYNHALALHLLVLLIHVYCLPEPDLTGSIYLDFTMFPPPQKKKTQFNVLHPYISGHHN